MLSWTNITIPNQYDDKARLIANQDRLKFELEQKQKECDLLYRELENIFRAAIEYKEIQVTSGKEKITLRLVEPTPQKGQSDE